MYIHAILLFLKFSVPLPVQLFIDNEAAVSSVRNPGATQRTRHYEIWVNYTRKLFLENKVNPVWVPTDKMTADIMTKPLDKTTFLKHRAKLIELITK